MLKNTKVLSSNSLNLLITLTSFKTHELARNFSNSNTKTIIDPPEIKLQEASTLSISWFTRCVDKNTKNKLQHRPQYMLMKSR